MIYKSVLVGIGVLLASAAVWAVTIDVRIPRRIWRSTFVANESGELLFGSVPGRVEVHNTERTCLVNDVTLVTEGIEASDVSVLSVGPGRFAVKWIYNRGSRIDFESPRIPSELVPFVVGTVTPPPSGGFILESGDEVVCVSGSAPGVCVVSGCFLD